MALVEHARFDPADIVKDHLQAGVILFSQLEWREFAAEHLAVHPECRCTRICHYQFAGTQGCYGGALFNEGSEIERVAEIGHDQLVAAILGKIIDRPGLQRRDRRALTLELIDGSNEQGETVSTLVSLYISNCFNLYDRPPR